MDQCFSRQKLYDAVDYHTVVEDILHSNWRFIIRTNTNVTGRMDPRQKTIMINQNHFDKGTATEGILCHEFIHAIIMGQRYL